VPENVTHNFRKGDYVRYVGDSSYVSYWAYGVIRRVNSGRTQADVCFLDGTCSWINDRGESWIRLENVSFVGRNPTRRQENALTAYIGELLNAT
jgi:hypothetical protein